MELTIKIPDEIAGKVRDHPDPEELIRHAVNLAFADSSTPRPSVPVDPDRHVRVPKTDPEKWDEQPVFRETFMWRVSDPEHASAFRVFSRAQYSMALEGGRSWDGTYAEAAAEELRAVVADLRHLQGLLAYSFEVEVDTLKEGYMTARKERLYRFTRVAAEKISVLADEIEREILESLQEDDVERRR